MTEIRREVRQENSGLVYLCGVAGVAAVLIIAAVPPFLVDAAGIVTALVAICGGGALLSRLKWVRWVWRHLISDPLGEWSCRWFRHSVGEWHAEVVEPRFHAIEEGIERANVWSEVLAEHAGLPPTADPRTLRGQSR